MTLPSRPTRTQTPQLPSQPQHIGRPKTSSQRIKLHNHMMICYAWSYHLTFVPRNLSFFHQLPSHKVSPCPHRIIPTTPPRVSTTFKVTSKRFTSKSEAIERRPAAVNDGCRCRTLTVLGAVAWHNVRILRKYYVFLNVRQLREKLLDVLLCAFR